jgi:acetylornithine deacetylase
MPANHSKKDSTIQMKALRYTKRLIGFDSTSSRSNKSISRYLEMKLTKQGFVVERCEYEDENGEKKVNLVAKKGAGEGGLAYFGHSDVVPAEKWFTEKFTPFEPAIARQRLYGRGSCDMKGSIGCMLAAAQQFDWDALKKPLYIAITADEEVGFGGARVVAEDSKFYREMVDHQTRAIIGEPTSLEVVHAHKGSVKIVAVANGVAGHSGGRQGENANLKMIPFLYYMKKLRDRTESQAEWQNDDFDPPTVSWNICIKDDSPALNVTAGKSVCTMYLRPMPGVDVKPLLRRVERGAKKYDIEIDIKNWGPGMFSDPESSFVQESLKLAHRHASQTVPYGTDGGVFSELENKIVFGPGNIAQAHAIDEWISLEQLNLGTEMYAKMIRRWCGDDSAA